MAISPAMQWTLANGGTEADVYKNINDFLATKPSAAETQAAMAQYGISPQDVAAATGGASGGLLSGNIMAGASWHGLNTTLADELLKVTGQSTTNVAVNGSTTGETLNQLNTFLANGGAFDPNATVYLQTGGVDFLLGYDKGVIKDNINQIVKTLGEQGVDVVLTGSPYAKSLQDVIDNKFDPKLDPIFNEIAEENKNVALVGIQGEILQNKNLVIDAVHTNAEGTAIYNQAVIDALSQFKNQVPASTPETIAQIQQTNTVATAPPIITQAASSPVVAQSLAQSIPMNTAARSTTNSAGRVVEGDNIDEQIANLPEMMYQTRTNPNNPAVWETYNPKTGEIVDTGVFAGGGDQGLLRAAAPVVGLTAAVLGAPYLSKFIAGQTGLTGSALAGATGATIGGGTQAVTGGTGQDILKGALLGGGGGYLGSELNNYLAARDVPVDFTNMTPEQITDATETNFINDLKRAGLSNAQIDDFMNNAGAGAFEAATTPVAVSTPVTDSGTVAITAPTTPSLSNVISTLASTVPTTETVKVTDSRPQQIDQAVLNLVNSQIAANAGNASNLANVQVTGQKPVTNQDIVNAIAATVPSTAVTQPVAQQTITAQKPVTTQDVINSIISATPVTTPTVTTPAVAEQVVTSNKPVTNQEVASIVSTLIPTITPVQAAVIAEQVITAKSPVTTQDAVNAVVATLTPTVTTPTVTTPEVKVTAQKPVTTQDVINTIAATLPITPAVTTPVVPEQTITAQRPSSITDVITAATIPLIQPSTPLTPTQVTAEKPLSDSDKIRLAQIGLTTAGLLGAGAVASSGSGGTQYPIVPIPPEFTTPKPTGVAPYTPLTPINFGDRNLLIGTQWEKFLNPNYGKVPEPIKYAQPTGLSYNDLMGILGSKQGMPSRSTLSINDVISGIQNQYGQTPTSTMG